MDEIQGTCELCGRHRSVTFHHLIPRTVHSNKWFKKRFTREEMNSGIYICRSCHSYLHKHFTHKQLARELNTKEALLSNEIVQRLVEWAKKRA